MNPDTLLQAAKADSIPCGASGLWFIRKFRYDSEKLAVRTLQDKKYLPPGTYTHLFRVTESTLYKDPPGTVVMEDTPFELKKHLQFMIRAKGKVLVTGLGLGCVARGLLANPNVAHVTCIEKSADVLKLVQPYMPTDRLTIVHADALEWTESNNVHFDYAWHDLWTDRDSGEPYLDLWHTRLIWNCHEKVKYQGAWAYSRIAKRLLSRKIKLIA